MASQEHLSILMRGILEWNKWRAEHQGIQPDLSGVNLCGGIPNPYLHIFVDDLTKAQLKKANIRGTVLVKGSLSGADLSGADLRRADLSGADLRRADLSGAN